MRQENESMPAPSEDKKVSLLVVDDDEGARRRLQSILEEENYRVIQAESSSTAIRLLQEKLCDLALIEIEMPDVDGLALCRLLRTHATTQQLPLIILSVSDDDQLKAEAFAAGADDYIVKPSSPRELLLRVRARLEASARTRALVGSNRELMFLADLGRSLLRALEPEQVVRRVAGATYEGTAAVLCAVAVNLHEFSWAICVFDREGSAEGESHLHMDRLGTWLATPESMSAVLLDQPASFFLRDTEHVVEYVAPLCFGGRAQGALIVGFDRRQDCTESIRRLVDAAAQQTALAAHVSSLYDAALDASITYATEEQKRFTDAIIDSLPISLYAVDRNYRIVAWNRNRELGGQGIPRDAAIGRNIFDVLTRQRRDILEAEFKRAFETGEIERFEQETTQPNGASQHWLISKIPMRNEGGMVTHVITVGEEITARVEANRAIGRAEKLAAVGRLAAGVVHEINNPLATIAACAEALESRVDEGVYGASTDTEDLRDYLRLIRDEAFRCKTITNGLLDFSRTRAGQQVPVNVSQIVQSAAHLLSHQSRGQAIEIRVDAAQDVTLISGDEGQLQQAVIALSTNAIDAMPDGGLLTLRTRDEDGFVRIEVSDTGVGISPEHLTKIFDPFFTTKEIGRGTGLGLAVCYGIVTEHGGRLDVQSTIGVGTTFTISIPSVPIASDGD